MFRSCCETWLAAEAAEAAEAAAAAAKGESEERAAEMEEAQRNAASALEREQVCVVGPRIVAWQRGGGGEDYLVCSAPPHTGEAFLSPSLTEVLSFCSGPHYFLVLRFDVVCFGEER